MARPRYRITAADVVHAANYLKPLLQTFAFELRRDASYKTADREFFEAASSKSKDERAEQLNAWCEKYLMAKTWGKLKLSIRKRRERKSRIGQLKSLSITSQAFDLIEKLAKRDQITYSEAIERHMGRALRKSR
jgi:macrodomain Ter protein organizer (MatP/YcbG family)